MITGTIDFYDGTTVVDSAPFSNGGATYATSSLSSGTHILKAVYIGDANFATSTSSPLSQTVSGAAATKTALISTPNPSAPGAQVTFTATVTSAAETPTGTVSFQEGATVLGTRTLSSGIATFAISTLTPGDHSITAVFLGNNSFAGSTSAIWSQTVSGKATPTVTLTVQPSSAQAGDTITFTATVDQIAGLPVPTGNVTFSSSTDGTQIYGKAVLNAQGIGVATKSGILPGNYTAVATYGGGGPYYNDTQSNIVSFTVK
jgi:hypothetical protein